MLFRLPKPNIRFLRREISDNGSKPLLILLLCHNKNIINSSEPEISKIATYPHNCGLDNSKIPRTIKISDTMESKAPNLSRSFHVKVGVDSVK